MLPRVGGGEIEVRRHIGDGGKITLNISIIPYPQPPNYQPTCRGLCQGGWRERERESVFIL